MKVSPILFSVPMVRALMDGRKTQTRRVLDGWTDAPPAYVEGGVITALDERDRPYRWPRTHAVGDLLWVREAWADVLGIIYRADYPENDPAYRPQKGWHPSIFMPRIASRLTLLVTDVRVQRVQAITRGDAMDEGCPFPNMRDGDDPHRWYADLWGQINGAGSWAANPWVAAYTFRVISANIDAALTYPATHGLPPGYGR